MSNAVQRSFRAALLSVLISVSASGAALAQSGSAGGSIGNDEKSLSGSRATPRAVESDRPSRRSKSEADEPRRASRRSGGGGGGSNFDGAWVVVSVGCGGSSTTAVVVTSGKIIGEGLTGTISPGGASRSVGNYNGITVISTGHASGRSGSGTFRRSDGCSGTWTSSKQ
ncbi:hypothetical protein I6F35_03580 [Bradyrhizobium sp. BRP22]|uniref:hypothetical protein n=1 Tax=Bradyrhizobium sp. BRP22 TaxID=2793821 RepID=UPI001CD6D479|nr:hypothetical protein [Bradyrhizobium sp. BRP22]MCA1452298.1 hypothetical protein [Bradyrhizobium sp. BRP22]